MTESVNFDLAEILVAIASHGGDIPPPVPFCRQCQPVLEYYMIGPAAGFHRLSHHYPDIYSSFHSDRAVQVRKHQGARGGARVPGRPGWCQPRASRPWRGVLRARGRARGPWAAAAACHCRAPGDLRRFSKVDSDGRHQCGRRGGRVAGMRWEQWACGALCVGAVP